MVIARALGALTLRRACVAPLACVAASRPYAATLGAARAPGRRADYAGDEPHVLLTAESLVSDGDLDLRDEYASAPTRRSTAAAATRRAAVLGRLLELQGIGFPLLIAPAYALGGAHGVELFLAAIAALGVRARRAAGAAARARPVGDGAALAVGLSPPALATRRASARSCRRDAARRRGAVRAARARAARAAGRVRRRGCCSRCCPGSGPSSCCPRRRWRVALVRWTARRGARTAGARGGRDRVRLAGRSTSRSTTGSSAASRPTRRRPRRRADRRRRRPATTSSGCRGCSALLLDRESACCAGRRCSRSALRRRVAALAPRRERLARALPERADAEVAAALALLVCAAQCSLVAAFAAPALPAWFPAPPR